MLVKIVVPEYCKFTRSNTPLWVFFTFLKNCTDGTKPRKASQKKSELEISSFFVLFCSIKVTGSSTS